ncbi:MAG: 3-deoxy-7-phosphoheptulonate synthase [Candidatus Adiutrix sp.]|jgi:3-deoxy-7-phosphoheptulonate synthase|nr:3-deoxy-7-phosphoheptulonate synthase [Candidatus Adiutrix sp.]
MIAVLKPSATREQIENLTRWLEGRGLSVHISKGEFYTVVGLIGDISQIDTELLGSLEMIDSVKRISEPFKSANRKFHPDDSVIDVSGLKIGGTNFQIIAGPCSVESPEQILTIARSIRASGATILRGGAFKPRTSPYDFQGMRADGIELLVEAKKQTGMPIITEIMNANHLPMFEQVDIIQVGARNMQNFELLKELGMIRKPVLLKRGLANTLLELLMSAEYIMAGGNHEVILCERGIRTFETYTRNTLDLLSVPLLRELSHLPVIVDPSHASGMARLVQPMAMAAAAAGAHGLMIEVHNDPPNALCDGAQSLTPGQFSEMSEKVKRIREAIAS